MKLLLSACLFCLLLSCKNSSTSNGEPSQNPFLVDVNVPVEYAKVTAADVEEYARFTVTAVNADIAAIKAQPTETFENIFVAMDDLNNKINVAYSNCHMMFWVSPDSLIRAKGLWGFQMLDSVSTGIYSDKDLFAKMVSFKSSDAYKELKGNRRIMVDDMILGFERSGVNLSPEQLEEFKTLTKEISELSSQYSDHMNASNDILTVDENGAKGLPESFKENYKGVEGKYEIPIINATNETVMGNAESEETRKAYYTKFTNRAAAQNLPILDSLIRKRDELAKVMGFPSYAAYNLVPKMAQDPQTVWNFVNDLISRSSAKAKSDIVQLQNEKKAELKDQKDIQLQTWDIAFFKNQILKKQYDVNNEELRAYLPMDQCLKGMFEIYQKLLDFEFRKVENPSVWDPEVEMYEVYEGDKLKGRFYMDLFPRPNKETWFYGVGLTPGRATPKGYEIPVSMLLGNFSRPTKTQPSLLSQKELNTLFHEFGHIMNAMSYHGEFASQSDSKGDFGEAMSQLFENWLWDYDILSSFAKHYKTGEVLPKATFDNMLKAKNVASGLTAIQQLQKCVYDLNLYDKYNPSAPLSTDQLWKDLDAQFGVMNFYVDNTHPQASWIHINTHPVYYYGYLWSRVYAQDMFTEFEKNGLTDTKTGVRYRELILANGTQRDIIAAVEEFLGRPSNNEAYIKSLGLN